MPQWCDAYRTAQPSRSQLAVDDAVAKAARVAWEGDAVRDYDLLEVVLLLAAGTSAVAFVFAARLRPTATAIAAVPEPVLNGR
jgi:hypothetical protein